MHIKVIMDNNDRANVRDSAAKKTSIFPASGDTSFIFAYKKSERLTTALFMITDFIDPKDPIRSRLRDKGLSLLGRVFDLYVEPSSHAFNRAAAATGEIVAMLNVISRLGYISPMNYALLEEEYSSLARFLREREEAFIVRPSNLSSSFFDVAVEPSEIKWAASDRPEFGMDTDASDTPRRPTPERYENRNVDPSAPHEPAARSVKGQTHTDTSRSSEQPRRKKDRRAIILSVLQEKDRITVNDLLPILTDVSSKTVQRELTALVEQGLLRKEGKKRWSTYMLA